jgi:hypothetical protein
VVECSEFEVLIISRPNAFRNFKLMARLMRLDRDRLPDVVEDRELLRHSEKVLQVYEGLSVDPSDCVLVHSDVGLHNVTVDDTTDAVNGMALIVSPGRRRRR